MGTLTLDFEKHTKRSCGSCALCCKLLPQKELSKPALTRCQYQRHHDHGSCSIYERRPPSCMVWSCQWLMSPGTEGLSRPDRSHVVIDLMPDVISINDGEKLVDMEALVVWVDPLYPDAWKHHSLMAYFEKQSEARKLAILIRYGSAEGMVAFAPSVTGLDRWIVQNSQQEWVERSSLDTIKRLERVASARA